MLRLPLSLLSMSFLPLLLLLSALPFTAAPVVSQEQTRGESFDLIIAGGRVLDGSGNPWFYADIGIRDGKIAAVGRLAGATAERTIDARNRMVAPGFIDIHSHADDGARASGGFRDPDPRYRAAPNLVMQGVTTVVVNHDGRSPWPIREQRDLIEANGIGPNTLLMVGHGTVRREVLGDDFRRPSTADELERMRALVRRAMEEGASGLSAGLEYVPGRWSTTDEVVALAEEIVPWGGVYISHQRGEGQDPMWYWPSQDEPGPPNLLDAVLETIEVGERTGATVVASHIKAKGANFWGSSHAAIQLIERARARGVDVWADQYTYNSSGTDGNTVMIPGWALAGAGGGQGGGQARGEQEDPPDYAAALRRTLEDPSLADDLRRDIRHEIARRGGAESVVVFDYPDTTYIGRSLAELAERRGISAVEMSLALQLEGYPDRRGGARSRGFSMTERDMEAFAVQPWVATASDAGIAMLDGSPGTHARFYGNFPRKIRHYALDREIITMEFAVRSMTSLPAQILGLRDRGMIREGLAADLVVFDPEEIRDRATFFEPHQYPEGIQSVLVNGHFVVDEGELTWDLPGILITPGTRGHTPAARVETGGR